MGILRNTRIRGGQGSKREGRETIVGPTATFRGATGPLPSGCGKRQTGGIPGK